MRVRRSPRKSPQALPVVTQTVQQEPATALRSWLRPRQLTGDRGVRPGSRDPSTDHGHGAVACAAGAAVGVDGTRRPVRIATLCRAPSTWLPDRRSPVGTESPLIDRIDEEYACTSRRRAAHGEWAAATNRLQRQWTTDARAGGHAEVDDAATRQPASPSNSLGVPSSAPRLRNGGGGAGAADAVERFTRGWLRSGVGRRGDVDPRRGGRGAGRAPPDAADLDSDAKSQKLEESERAAAGEQVPRGDRGGR